MKLQVIALRPSPTSGFLLKACAFAIVGLGLCVPAAWAKPTPLIAIEVYDGPAGPAYLQLGDLLINGKAEMRDCTPFQAGAVDKSTYGKMQKVTLAAGMVLDRDSEGVLRYGASGTSPLCVVPDNVKFEHNASYSLSDLADQAKLTGTVLGGTATAIPPIQKGVKLVLVAAPDQELAEFLLALRSANIDAWLHYLSKYPTALHSADAKHDLAVLYVSAGQASLAQYRKSAGSASPSYKDLKDAKTQAEQALAVLPAQEQAAKLLANVRKELAALAQNGNNELDAYNKALKTKTAGYSHLQNAASLSETIAGIDPAFQPGQALIVSVTQALNTFDEALRSAESAVSQKQMDKAMEFISPLIPFSAEEPRVPAVLDAAYGYYFQLGRQFTDAADWDNAIKNLDKAAMVKDTTEVHDALDTAHKQLIIAQDKAAAAKALDKSKDYEGQHDNINAFEVLYFLPASQKALVGDDIERLKAAYIQSAANEAKQLQKAHGGLNGLADEIGIEEAHTYLQRAYELTQEDSYKDTMAILAEDLSKYFVERAKIYLDKPSGSGTELGWNYLDEALFYVPSNQSAHDEKVAAAAAHAMHSRLSLRVQFRDQTSLRDRESTGFIHQLEDAIITGLEAPTLKAVRFGETTGGVEPDFQLAGDVLEHQITETPTVTAKESKYRAGTHDEPNEEWNKANRAFEAAGRNLQTDQSALQGAESKGNKRDIKDLNAKITEDMKAVSDAQAIVDSVSRTLTTDVIRPYNYTQRTIDIKNAIRLQFRIGETLSGQMGEPVLVEKEDPRQYVLVEDVKADDTAGVKPSGTTPDTKELQTMLENSTRDLLIESAKKKVKELPHEIYSQAESKEKEENADGAAEAYLRFLSCTTEDGSAERKHAKEFLLKNFNMRPDAGASR